MNFKRTSCGTQSPYLSPSPPPGSDSSRRNPAPTHNASIHCQPSEDADYTVTDLLPSPVIRNPHVLDPNAYRFRQNTPLPISNGVAFPDINGDARECVTMSVAHDSESSELNLHSDPSPSTAVADETNGEGLTTENMSFTVHSRTERPHNRRHDMRRPTAGDWNSDVEDVDSPGLGARPAGSDEAAMLRHNYNRLLENHQRFVVSNAQLHNNREELIGRVTGLEMELEEATSVIRSLELDKQHLSDEVASLQRTLGILRDQMPLLATEDGQPWQQATNDKRNGADEWTSSLKEELKQTIMLAMKQQQELNGLYKVIKQQNEAIRRLTLTTTSDPKDKPQLRFQDDYHGFRKNAPVETPPKQLELRENPEGSSVSALERVKGQRSADCNPPPPPPEVRSGNVTSPLKDSIRNFFGAGNGPSSPKHKSTTTTGDPSSPSTTVAKRPPAVAKQHPPSSSALPPHGRTSQRNRQVMSVQGPPDHLHSDVDLENAGFVFVDSSLAGSRICPLCGVVFPNEGTTMEQFVEHVSQCVPPAEHRQCPVCLERFDKTVTDRTIEMHVNEHFDEDRFQCLSPVENK